MQKPLIQGVTATTTSPAFNVENLTQITVILDGNGITASNTGTLTIDASNDGINWVTSIGFIDMQATNKSTALVNSKVTSGTGSQAVGALLSSDFGAKIIRATVTVALGGGVGTYDIVLQATKFAVT